MTQNRRSIKNPSVNGEMLRETHRKESDKEILAIFTKGLSPNQIVHWYEEVKRERLMPHKVREVLQDYGSRIKKLNAKFDEIAARYISMIEMDETFKGRRYIVLVVMDSLTGYVFMMKKIKRRNERHIRRALESIRHILRNVKVVLTDEAPYFSAIVKDFCPNALHQICLVHVMRNIKAEVEKLKSPYLSVLKKYKVIRKRLHNIGEKVHEKRYNLKKLKQRRRYRERQRSVMHAKLGIRPYQKNILSTYPELRKINYIINNLDGQIRSLENTIVSLRARRDKYEHQLGVVKKELNRKWAEYMGYLKLKKRFHRLFFHRETEFLAKKTAFISELKGKKKNGMIT